jgi:hypothetical protein
VVKVQDQKIQNGKKLTSTIRIQKILLGQFQLLLPIRVIKIRLIQMGEKVTTLYMDLKSIQIQHMILRIFPTVTLLLTSARSQFMTLSIHQVMNLPTVPIPPSFMITKELLPLKRSRKQLISLIYMIFLILSNLSSSIKTSLKYSKSLILRCKILLQSTLFSTQWMTLILPLKSSKIVTWMIILKAMTMMKKMKFQNMQN